MMRDWREVKRNSWMPTAPFSRRYSRKRTRKSVNEIFSPVCSPRYQRFLPRNREIERTEVRSFSDAATTGPLPRGSKLTPALDRKSVV